MTRPALPRRSLRRALAASLLAVGLVSAAALSAAPSYAADDEGPVVPGSLVQTLNCDATPRGMTLDVTLGEGHQQPSGEARLQISVNSVNAVDEPVTYPGTHSYFIPLEADGVYSYSLKVGGGSWLPSEVVTMPEDCASEPTFVMITSDPVQIVTDAGDVTLTFGYDLRPDVDRDGQDAVVEAHVVTAGGDWIYFPSPDGSDLTTVEGPGTFTSTISLAPGTYTRYIQSTYPLDCDCADLKDIAPPYVFTVPELTGPTPTPTASPTATPGPTSSPEPTVTTAPTPSPAPTNTTASASVSLSSSTVTPGGALTVTGRGYAPGEAIELWLHSTPVKLWSGTASADGAFSRTVTIPDTTTPGSHRIEVRAGNGIDSQNLTVTSGLAVTGVESSSVAGGGSLAALLLAVGVSLMVLHRRTNRV